MIDFLKKNVIFRERNVVLWVCFLEVFYGFTIEIRVLVLFRKNPAINEYVFLNLTYN